MSPQSPTLFSYVVRYDDGAAPNPYWGKCTLVICKPSIRRVAKKGDWIVGLGSKLNPSKIDYSGKIVYVMKVSEKMKMSAYDTNSSETLRNKIPVIPNGRVELKKDSYEWRLRLGDSIYDFSKKGIPQRRGVHKRANRKTDLSGENALLSSKFVYFGENAEPIPKTLRGIIHRTQGHRSKRNAPYLSEFIKWWESRREEFAKNPVRGAPQLDVFASAKNLRACATAHRKEAEQDDRLDLLALTRT